jgi:hypothetical protein
MSGTPMSVAGGSVTLRSYGPTANTGLVARKRLLPDSAWLP